MIEITKRTWALAAPQARRLTSSADEADTPLIYATICAKCSDDGHFCAVQILLGQTMIENTVRYLSVDV